MVAGAKGDTPEVVCQYLNIPCDTYSDTTNVEYALSCTQPNKNRRKRGRGTVPWGQSPEHSRRLEKVLGHYLHIFFFFFGFESTQLARQLQQERTQMEVH